MLNEPGLLQSIREEIDTAFVDNSLDIHRLEEFCPRLQGLWLEVLRLTVSSSSVRFITEDTIIGGKCLGKGNILVNSCRQLHFNELVFGQDPSEFNPSRFLDNKRLERSRSWKPFGGGLSLCPGRIIAKRTACMFIALVLHRFYVDLAFGQPFPQPHDKTPDLGIFVAETDVIIKIRERSVR